MKLLLLPLVLAANIIITTTDSWVDKGPRYLEWALREQGHDVKVIAPLYHNTDASSAKMAKKSGYADSPAPGDFNHLLPSHQTYLRNKRMSNRVVKNAKKGISSEQAQGEDKSQIFVRDGKYGQDPQNPNFWYFEGSSLEGLSTFFKDIMPSHLPEFKPDLVIVGPNEGLHLTAENTDEEIEVENLEEMQNQAEALALFAQVQGLPVMIVSSEDNERVYYADEGVFNVGTEKYTDAFMMNSVAQNVKFINDKVTQLVDEVAGSLTSSLSLNVNFPSMNHHHSHCMTSSRKQPRFLQVVEAAEPKLGKIVGVPTYGRKREEDSVEYVKLSDKMITPLNSIEAMRLSVILSQAPGKQELAREEISEELMNEKELSALEKCHIAVAVNHITKGNNLGTDVFALNSR